MCLGGEERSHSPSTEQERGCAARNQVVFRPERSLCGQGAQEALLCGVIRAEDKLLWEG